MPDTIRRDLFAVKEQQDGVWVTIKIMRDRTKAHNYAEVLDAFRTGRKTKVVHPSQFTVEAFVIVGNEIQ